MIIDGKAIAAEIQEELRKEVALIRGRKPALAVILVGDHPPSRLYTSRKAKACESVGIQSIQCRLPGDIAEGDLLKQIELYNLDPSIDGILIQLPLPSHINQNKILHAVLPQKDVDGFHPENMGKLLVGDKTGFVPCTPLGIRELLYRLNVDLQGKHVVIVGRSNIVGKPMAAMLMQRGPQGNCTVTVANSFSNDLPFITRSADILIAAMGKPKAITKEMVKPGSIVIDVGINRENGKVVGDVDYLDVKEVASMITPVPGGVGPMTIAMLLQNTVKAFRK